jgi:cyclic pyranopterin phosphate synthase
MRDLRISVTDRCNFRCTYCMPAEIFGESYVFLPREQLLTFEEITRVARLAVGLGVVKLRITGGEPLVRQELEKLIAMLTAIPGVEDIALTTNGKLLPQKAAALREAGLKRITISLDSLDNDTFRKMNGGRANVEDVLRGIDSAVAVGLSPIKINCVVIRGVNDDKIIDLARFCRERGFIARFIEYMDVGTRNGWEMCHVVPAKEIVSRLDAVFPLEPAQANYRGEVAERWRYRDGGGEIGVIASVTQPFCGDCTRLRLSAEGELYTCLFAVKGTDLKGPIRAGATDEELMMLMRGTWHARTDRYSEERASAPRGEKIEMYYIGG